MLVVAALAGLAYWFVETQGEGETFKDKLLDIWNKIQEKVQAVIDWFKSFWDENGAQIKAEWDEVWNGIKETFDSVWTSIQDIATSVGGWLETFWENWGERVTEFLSDAWENIKRIFSGALKLIRGWFEFFAGLFTGDWGRMWDGLKQVFSGAWDLVMGAIGFALDKLKLALELAWGAIKSVASAAWNGIVDGIKSIWDGIVDAVSGPIRRVMQFIQENFIDKINGFFAFLHIPVYIKPIWTAATGRPQHDSWRPGSFDSGGYTGNVPVDRVAGVVHGREFVINAASTARLRRDRPGFLEGLNGYRTGGYVSPALGAKIAASVPGYRSGGRVRDLEIWDVQPARKAAPAPAAPKPQPEQQGGGNIFSTVFDAIKGALAATIRNTIGGLANLAAMGVEPFGFFGQAAAGAVRSMGSGAAGWAIRTLGLEPAPLTPTLYDQGGLVPPGLTLVSNQTGRPEMLLPPDFGRQDGPMDLSARTVRALGRAVADHIQPPVTIDDISRALVGRM
jgi:hypothetical protein